jgi:uncharacterized membrane protein YccC
MGRWLTRHRPAMAHAVRLTTAGAAAFTLFGALGTPHALWAVITALLVTQSSVGGSFKAALDQLVGSLFGAACGAVVALAVSPDDPLSGAAALVAALAPLSILAALSAGFRIAPITAAIVLLGGIGSDTGPLGLAAGRVLDVGLGCGVGLLVSVLVVPARASRSVVETAARMANLMAEQLDALASRGDAGRADLAPLAARTRASLSRLESVVEEAARERRSGSVDIPDGTPLLRAMARLRRDIGMLRRPARGARRDAQLEHVAEAWSCAAATSAAALRRIGRIPPDRHAPEDRGALAQAVRGYRVAADGAGWAGPTGALPTAAAGRLFGIGCAPEQLPRDLDDLVERSREIAAFHDGPAGAR